MLETRSCQPSIQADIPFQQAILSELKLSQEGKKADLVTRILEQQSGSSQDASSTANGATATGTDDKAAASSDSSKPAGSSESVTETSMNTANGGVEAQSSDNAGKEEDKASAPAQELSLPLPAESDKNGEAEKRINRLKRFGNPDDIAKLERMEKFGTQVDAVDEKVSPRKRKVAFAICTRNKHIY